MWAGYSLREASDLVGLSESVIRSCVRSGFMTRPSDEFPHQFTFRDLSILRTVRALRQGGVSARRLRRQLSLLCSTLPDRGSLAEMSLTAIGGDVVAHSGARPWRVSDGQVLMDFFDLPAEEIVPLCDRRPECGAQAPAATSARSADEWFERGLALEEDDSDEAMRAYERALAMRPNFVEGWVNVGRLYAEDGDILRAREAFERALELVPDDATALYNLGVVAQDEGDDTTAITLYLRALCADANLSEAHYNLATIYDRTGDPQAAIRHIHAYRKLTRS